MLTAKGSKPKLSGFRCRELQIDTYKTLRSFMQLTGATCEEALQTFIQFSAWGWQSPQHREQLTGLVQGWKRQRPREEIIVYPFTA